MLLNLEKYEKFLNNIESDKKIRKQQKTELEQQLTELKELGKYLNQSQEVMNTVGILAQTEFQDVVESLVTQALQSVFGAEHSFVLENEIHRKQPETYMYVKVNGKKRSLDGELGGGVLDVVSFALRVVFWAIGLNSTEPVIILDEPLKFVSEDRFENIRVMFKTLADLLNLQIIMVSHENQLIQAADRCYSVRIEKNKNGENISKVERVI